MVNDGAYPYANVVQGSDGNFYGTTANGGASATYGTVFQMSPSGSVTILHNFQDGSVVDDGAYPEGPLTQGVDGSFYGTTANGGTGVGTIFNITTDGAYVLLHSFGDGSTFNDGSGPGATLVEGNNGNFYGLTSIGGGAANQGTFYEMTPDGNVTILHSFNDGSVANDGTNPTSGLVEDANGNLYGTTIGGGDSNNGGTIFELGPAVAVADEWRDGGRFADAAVQLPGDGDKRADDLRGHGSAAGAVD